MDTFIVCPDRSEFRLLAVVLEDEVMCLLVKVTVRSEMRHVADDLSSVVRMDSLVVSHQDRADLLPGLGVIVHTVVTWHNMVKCLSHSLDITNSFLV